MPRVFSAQTLSKFEDASAGVPLRPLDRAFTAAGISLGDDPGGDAGSRKTQFRRYVASINQHDPEQLDRLGSALGAMIACVAASKEEFLIKAAQTDGFFFESGTFRPASVTPLSFAVTREGDLASIDERGKRLSVLSDANPRDAILGAIELAESVLEVVERLAAFRDRASEERVIDGDFARHMSAAIGRLGERRKASRSGSVDDEDRHGVSPRHARLVVAVAVAFSSYLAETYAELRRRS